MPDADDRLNSGQRMDPRMCAWVFAVCAFISVVAHVNAFFVQHTEGDEIVYATLAREMGWDLSHYTTRDDPVVREFPYTIYQGAVFHHPPLIPYVLKIGMAFDKALRTALVFELCVALVFIAVALALLRDCRAGLREVVVVVLLFTCCPLVITTTSRVFLDGPGAVFCFTGVALYIMALRRSSSLLALGAALALVLGLNARYSSILIMPVVVLVQVFHVGFRIWDRGIEHLRRRRWREALRMAMAREHWGLFALVMIFVVPLGLQHYARVGLNYGTIFPGSLYGPRPERFTPFLTLVEGRSRLRMIVYLFALFPMLALLLLPPYWRAFRRRLVARDLAAAVFLAFPYLICACLVFQHCLMRYYTIAMPFFYVTVLFMLRDKSVVWRRVTMGLVVVSLVSMAATSYVMTVSRPTASRIFPAAFYYLKPLQQHYL